MSYRTLADSAASEAYDVEDEAEDTAGDDADGKNGGKE